MTAALAASDRARIARGGMVALPTDHALRLLDLAIARPEALAVPVRFERSVLRPGSAPVPPLLRALVAAAVTAGGQAVPVVAQIAALPPAEREAALLDRIQRAAAAVLGAVPGAIDPDRPLSELGLDSLMAVELRNQLNGLTGLRLSSSLIFDYPTLRAQAAYLRGELWGDEPTFEQAAPTSLSDADLRALLGALPLEQLRASAVLGELLRMASPRSTSPPAAPADRDLADDIQSMDIGDLIRLAQED